MWVDLAGISVKNLCIFFYRYFSHSIKKYPNRSIRLPPAGLLGVTRHQESVLGFFFHSTIETEKVQPLNKKQPFWGAHPFWGARSVDFNCFYTLLRNIYFFNGFLYRNFYRIYNCIYKSLKTIISIYHIHKILHILWIVFIIGWTCYC